MCFLALFLLLAPRAARTDPIEVPSPADQAKGNFGNRVLGISDFTGDGIGELVVGALHNADPRGPRGAVFILNGQDFSLVSRSEPPYPGGGWRGDAGSFGWSLAELSDLNGDGISEILAGANYAEMPDQTTFGYGRAYVIDPTTGAILRTLSPPLPQRGTFFGYSVAGLRTKTAGQTVWIAVGAPNGSPGKVHLFDATSGEFLLSISAPTPRSDDWFGVSLASIGDVDGDGRADLAVGAGRKSGGMGINPALPGAAYIASGGTGKVMHELIAPDLPPNTRFRWSVAAVPDVNADGKTDVLVGISLASPPGGLVHPGRAYLFSGAGGQWLRTLASPAPQTNGYFGWAVAGLPDITGDGAGELLISAAAHTGFGFKTWGERRVYLMNGATGQMILSFKSPDRGEAFGLSVTGILDRNGKLQTVVSGAPQEEPPPSEINAGRVYAFPLSLSFLSASTSDRGLRLSLTATDDKSYDIQASQDLQTWITLTTLKGASVPATFLDTQATGIDRRFYRAREANALP